MIVEIIVLLGLTLYHFNDISSKFPLVDFPIDRRMFTWSNWRLSPNMAKLDRFLVSLSCGAKFPQSFVNWLLSDVFDHVPIVLSSDSNFNRRKRLLFKRMWLIKIGFRDLIVYWWHYLLVNLMLLVLFVIKLGPSYQLKIS